MKRTLGLLAVVSLVAGGWAMGQGAGDAKPTAYVAATKTPPKIDGKLDDEAWKTATVIHLTRTLDGASAAAQPTEVRLLRDDATLYLAFRCTEPAMNQLTPGDTGADVSVWTGDSMEFFLGLGCDYCHFGVDAAGGTYDAEAKDAGWASGMMAAVSKGTNEWIAEVAVPSDKILPGKGTKPRKEWTANFNRNRYVTGVLEEMAWSPTFSGDSHMPERFGKLIFADPPQPGSGQGAGGVSAKDNK